MDDTPENDERGNAILHHMQKVMDHARYQRDMKGKTVAELLYIIKDAGEAAAVNPQNINCGYYLDEVHYAADELRRRKYETVRNKKWEIPIQGLPELPKMAYGILGDMELSMSPTCNDDPGNKNDVALSQIRLLKIKLYQR